MEKIVVFTPVIASLLTLLFYYVIDLNDKRLRLIPMMLICILIETIYFAYLYMQYPILVFTKIITPPLTILTIVFIFFFMYETLTKTRISTMALIINFIPVIFWAIVFVAVETKVINQEENSINIYLGRQITGLIMATIYFLILLPGFNKKRISGWRNIGVAESLMFQLLLLGIVLVLSVFSTIVTGVFYGMAFYFIKILEFGVVLTLYLLLFREYRLKLENLRNKRLKTLQPISEILLKHKPLHHNVKNKMMQPQVKVNIEKTKKTKYEKVLLHDNILKQYSKQIIKYFDQEHEEYLNSDFNIGFLSKKTGIQKSHLSQVFNIKMGKSFNLFLNEKRIIHACKILKNNKNIPVSELSDVCGYRSRTTFYRQFRSITGQSVQGYIRSKKF